MRVVDRLEVVEVDEHEQQILLQASSELHLLLGQHEEPAAVVEAGKIVSHRHTAQLALQPMSLGEVARVDDHRRHTLLIEDGVADHLHESPVPIPMAKADLHRA
jgi:hypothetical protein